MTAERLAAHWRVLEQCEAGGANPRVYRELLTALHQAMTALSSADAIIAGLQRSTGL